MSLPHKNEEYGTEVYWDKRYEQYVSVCFLDESQDTVDD
jgi:hypothetical protein